MGGFGSGRNGGKRCADDLRQIDIRRLSRDGYLKAGMSYGWQWAQRGEEVASINLSVEADRVSSSHFFRELVIFFER